LDRIIRKFSPAGENNEQFRDCCIWEAAIELAKERKTYVVTNDFAFYDAGDRKRGLAPSLRASVELAGVSLEIFPTLRDFLAAVHSTTARLDETAIRDQLVEALRPKLRELGHSGNIGAVTEAKPDGFSTPQPSLIAVSFSVTCDLVRPPSEDKHGPAALTVRGGCSYEPATGTVSEIEVRSWESFLKESHRTSWGVHHLGLTEKQVVLGYSRIIP
jgi:hypothetical protein